MGPFNIDVQNDADGAIGSGVANTSASAATGHGSTIDWGGLVNSLPGLISIFTGTGGQETPGTSAPPPPPEPQTNWLLIIGGGVLAIGAIILTVFLIKKAAK